MWVPALFDSNLPPRFWTTYRSSPFFLGLFLTHFSVFRPTARAALNNKSCMCGIKRLKFKMQIWKQIEIQRTRKNSLSEIRKIWSVANCWVKNAGNIHNFSKLIFVIFLFGHLRLLAAPPPAAEICKYFPHMYACLPPTFPRSQDVPPDFSIIFPASRRVLSLGNLLKKSRFISIFYDLLTSSHR